MVSKYHHSHVLINTLNRLYPIYPIRILGDNIKYKLYHNKQIKMFNWYDKKMYNNFSNILTFNTFKNRNHYQT